LLEHDEDLANEVIRNETRINSYELTIDRQCEQIFALLTPVAHDMRLVFATLKINADLERIGDYAEGISKLVLLGKKQFDPVLIEEIGLVKMADTTKEMLTQVIKAYCEEDSTLARMAFTRDLELNEINHHATDIAIGYCKNNIERMHQAMYLLSIVRKLERVGDHITNIAEEIIFFKEAKILKHGNKGEELR
jgi:phosphate transport system protein